ncbi:hypothetical protein VaNZ11_001252 [Volvox africanus]|uniref:Integral membrane bound transporter domain-containing protein n=1 Tax=Volvox africanus TaxID=51714 RepID=A0ABQ5RP98_9CHLO|nr:hypothetical protein VaNZ11_001252 [Volvox africanus]
MAPIVSHVQSGLHRVSMGLRQHAASIQKIKVDFSKVPDWTRRATRLSIALVFFGILGHCAKFSPEHQVFASNFRQSCNWAAITCIVVTAPLIGKVAQVAFDRLLGTAVGGLIGCVCFTVGFHMFGAFGGGIFISLMSGVAVWTTTYIAYKFSMDQLVRFVQLTYIIVAFGAKPDKGAFLLALLRVGGIFAGGLLSVVLAVVVLPRSASIDCLLEMKKALKALYDLNQEVWAVSGMTGKSMSRRSVRKTHRHGYSALQLRLDAAAASAALKSNASDPAMATAMPPDVRCAGSGRVDRVSSLPDGLRRGLHDSSLNHLNLLVQRDAERDLHEAAIEKLFTAVYTALGRVDEHLAQTRGEIYIWHFWGRYFFLPGVHWFPVTGRWRVPKEDLDNMVMCVRRVARMLWTLLLDFEEGFGSEMEAVLQLYYPKQLLSELAEYQARAILDLLRAFPGASTIEVDNLFTLGLVTDCLMQISDARARNTVFKMKRRRATAAAPSGVASPGPRTGRGTATVSVRGPLQGDGEVVKTADCRRSVELSMTRLQQPGNCVSAPAAGVEIEKQPLLAAIAQSSSAKLAAPNPTAGKDGSGWGESGSGYPFQRLSEVGSGVITGGPGMLHSGLAAVPVGDLTGEPSGGSNAGAAGASGGDSGLMSGMFISRLMSGTPGELMTLHLPPRRYLQEQQQQQQRAQKKQGQLERGLPTTLDDPAQGADAAVVQTQPLTIAQRQGSIDIFGGVHFNTLLGDRFGEAAVLENATSGAAVAAADMQSPVGTLAAAPPDASGHSASSLPPRPRSSTGDPASRSMLPMPASLSPPPQQQQQKGQAYAGHSRTPFDTSTNVPNWMEQLRSSSLALSGSEVAAILRPGSNEPSAAAAATVTGAASTTGLPQAPVPPKTVRTRISPTRTVPQAAAAADVAVATGMGSAGCSTSVRSSSEVVRGTHDRDLERDGIQRLNSALLSVSVEPVTFPPTEEGYLSQVRWYSFQFVMDEMVNELEEAFHACSALLQKLPYPIGN